jgi:hypothetical protein
MSGAYPTNPFVFTFDCPAGYYCVPGTFPRTITIPPGDVPPVIINPDDGLISLKCCDSTIFRRLSPGMTPAMVAAAIASIENECAQLIAQCVVFHGGGDGNPSFPPPTRIPTGQGGRVDVCNDEQCYTAVCPGGSPSVTKCVNPQTICTTLFNATPQQIHDTQAMVDNQAQTTAQANAQAALGPLCGICNSEVSGFRPCGENPAIIVHATVAAATYCVAQGTVDGQQKVDALASTDLNNQLFTKLGATGCTCTGFHVTAGLVYSACCATAAWNKNSPFLITICPGSPFDPVAQFIAYNGAQPPGWHLGESIIYSTPNLVQYF